MSDPLDLSGPWYGRWSGTGGVRPGRFVALLTEVGGAVTGQASEPDPFGRADVIRAILSGHREGASVRLVKQYDGAVMAHAVDYVGQISAEGTLLSGRWSFAAYAGTFVMERERFTEDELLAEDAREREDAR